MSSSLGYTLTEFVQKDVLTYRTLKGFDLSQHPLPFLLAALFTAFLPATVKGDVPYIGRIITILFVCQRSHLILL
jgi:hypothetical protein